MKKTLKEMREAAGVTATECAAACGVQVRTIGKWDGGHTRPGRAAVDKMAALLGVSPADIAAAIESTPRPALASPAPAAVAGATVAAPDLAPPPADLAPDPAPPLPDPAAVPDADRATGWRRTAIGGALGAGVAAVAGWAVAPVAALGAGAAWLLGGSADDEGEGDE